MLSNIFPWYFHKNGKVFPRYVPRYVQISPGISISLDVYLDLPSERPGRWSRSAPWIGTVAHDAPGDGRRAWRQPRSSSCWTLWLCQNSHETWPIEIDGLPFLKIGGSFHGKLLVITRWYPLQNPFAPGNFKRSADERVGTRNDISDVWRNCWEIVENHIGKRQDTKAAHNPS